MSIRHLIQVLRLIALAMLVNATNVIASTADTIMSDWQERLPAPLVSQLTDLPAVTQQAALQALSDLNPAAADLPRLRLDANGLWYHADYLVFPDTSIVPPVAESVPPLTALDAFSRHSKAGASHVVYLDFDGHALMDSAWNDKNALYIARAYSLDTQVADFNQAEFENIIAIWKQVSASFAAGDVDITTEEPSASVSSRRILITQDTDMNGLDLPAKGADTVTYTDQSTLGLVYYNNLDLTQPSQLAQAIVQTLPATLGVTKQTILSSPRIVSDLPTEMAVVSPLTIPPLTEGKTLSVTKTGSGVGTVTSVPDGIQCGTVCSDVYPTKTKVSLTATAATGSKFVGWTGCTSKTNICTLTLSDDKSVTANFVAVNTLTVETGGTGLGTVNSKPTGINCGSDCREDYPADTPIILTAKASKGSVFSGWSGACADSTTATCTISLASSQTVTALFNKLTYSLNVSKTGSGTITSAPLGIECGNDCQENYAPNTTVTLTATPALGYQLGNWVGCSSKTNRCTVKMSAAKTVTVNFTPISSLTVSQQGTGGGTVTSKPTGIQCGATCTKIYPANTLVTLTASAATGSRFTGWSGDCSGIATCTLTVIGVKNVTATFESTVIPVERVEIDASFEVSAYPSPYVITSQNQGANVFLLGAQHDSNVNSGTYKTIKHLLDTNAITNIILEGVPNAVSIDQAFGSLPCVKDPTQCKSEMHYAYALAKAKNTGITFKGGEAGTLKEYQHMLANTQYTLQDYVGFLYTRDAIALNASGQMSESALKTQIDRHRSTLQQELSMNIAFNYDSWISWYKTSMQVASVNLGAIKGELLNPNVETTLINRISRELNVVRDTNLVATINGLLAPSKQVLVVYGSGHIGTIYSAFTRTSSVIPFLIRWY